MEKSSQFNAPPGAAIVDRVVLSLKGVQRRAFGVDLTIFCSLELTRIKYLIQNILFVLSVEKQVTLLSLIE